MSPLALSDAFFYRHRRLLSGVLLLVIVYFITFSRLAISPLSLFLGWSSETQLVVLPTIEEAYREVVQPGDVVLAVDGRPVQRGDMVFSFPARSAYTLTLQRGSEVITQEITVVESQLFDVWELSKNVLALLIWLLGFLTAQFARPAQRPAVIMGLSFQLIAAGILSPGPAQLGAPGAWLVADVLIFYFPLILLYASFMPRYTPLPERVRPALGGLLIFLTFLALLAVIEHLFLFPTRSLSDLVGLSLQTILTVLTGLSLVTAVVVVLLRVLRLPKLSYERQQLTILLVFLVLAVTPLFFFLILPVTTLSFPPLPVIYSFLLLVPAGYFFVLHRQGHLALDSVFSQIITIGVLILAVVIAYTTGLFLATTLFQQDLAEMNQGMFVLALLSIALAGQKPIQSYVDVLLYGRYPLGDAVIQKVTTDLSANPEVATITATLAYIASQFQVEHTAVLGKQADQFVWLAGNTPPITVPFDTGQTLSPRSHRPELWPDLPDWVELSLPLIMGEETVGLFLLAAPVNGFFNSRQVHVLQDIARILTLSLRVVNLVEAGYSLFQRSLYKQEMQRKQIATEIHNRPLDSLTLFLRQLEQADGLTDANSAARVVRQVTEELRSILAGLRPRIVNEAAYWIAHNTLLRFKEMHSGIVVEEDLAVEADAAETVKLAFYYILTEALNNIGKHAQSDRVGVTLTCNEALLLQVKDNGRGPGVAMLSLSNLVLNRHVGVVDMHHWARLVEGELKICENTEGGTIVELTLPLVSHLDKAMARSESEKGLVLLFDWPLYGTDEGQNGTPTSPATASD